MNVLASTSAVADSPNDGFLRLTYYKNKCKVRCFYSKGAFLVLIWFCLIIGNAWSLIQLYNTLFQGLKGIEPYRSIAAFFCTGPIVWVAC